MQKSIIFCLFQLLDGIR